MADEQMKACREKYWSESAIEEKIERMRMEVKYLQSRMSVITQTHLVDPQNSLPNNRT